MGVLSSSAPVHALLECDGPYFLYDGVVAAINDNMNIC